MKTGDWVVILSVKGCPAAKLMRPLADVRGGWVLDRRIDGFSMWNEDDMRMATRTEIRAAESPHRECQDVG